MNCRYSDFSVRRMALNWLPVPDLRLSGMPMTPPGPTWIAWAGSLIMTGGGGGGSLTSLTFWPDAGLVHKTPSPKTREPPVTTARKQRRIFSIAGSSPEERAWRPAAVAAGWADLLVIVAQGR